jgi:hypothetical protein
VASLQTEPISLNDRRESFEAAYEVRGIRPQWYTETHTVAVKVGIREKEVSRILEDVPVRVAGATRRVTVEPATIALRLKGPAGKVKSLLGEKMDVSIDARALELEKRGKASFRIRPVPPKHPGVEITMIPDNVRVTVLRD